MRQQVEINELEKVIKTYKNMKLVYMPMFKKLYILKNGKVLKEFKSPSGYEDAKKEFARLREEEVKNARKSKRK